MLLLGLNSCKNQEEKLPSKEILNVETNIDPTRHIIEVETLLGSLNEPSLKIIDFRKQEDYDKGHIPKALHIWRNNIEDGSYPYKGMMADKKTIEKLFSRLGIQTHDTLIVYDDRGGYDAARLWWVLHNHNFDAVKILNGGLRAWVAANGTVSKEQKLLDSTSFRLPEKSHPQLLVKREELHDLLSSEKRPFIIDTRTADEYSGKRQKAGANKGGRIPSSKLIDWSRTVDYHGTHKFRSISELEKLYGSLVTSKNDPIITYCHSGTRSAHTTFVLTQLLGYTNVRNYDGSWSEWSYFDNLPVEKDSVTTILQ